MRSEPVSALWPQTDAIEPAGAWMLAIGILAVSIALAISGCASVPHHAEPNPATPGTMPGDDARTASSSPTRIADPRTEFHEKATDRQSFQVHIDFGRAFESQGNLDAAIHEYQDALTVIESKRRGPFRPADEAIAHRRLGGAFDRQGRFAQAETHYKKALQLTPKDARVWNDAGYSYYLQGRWVDAERTLKTAARLAPDDERIRTNLGLTIAAAGRPDEALPLLSQTSGDAIGHANLGYLLAATGQVDLARRQYETALALRPDLTVARRALARMDRNAIPSTDSPRNPDLLAQQTTRPAQAVVDTGVRKATMAPIQDLPPLPTRILPEATAAGAPNAASARVGAMSRAVVTLPPPPALP